MTWREGVWGAAKSHHLSWVVSLSQDVAPFTQPAVTAGSLQPGTNNVGAAILGGTVLLTAGCSASSLSSTRCQEQLISAHLSPGEGKRQGWKPPRAKHPDPEAGQVLMERHRGTATFCPIQGVWQEQSGTEGIGTGVGRWQQSHSKGPFPRVPSPSAATTKKAHFLGIGPSTSSGLQTCTTNTSTQSHVEDDVSPCIGTDLSSCTPGFERLWSPRARASSLLMRPYPSAVWRMVCRAGTGRPSLTGTVSGKA